MTMDIKIKRADSKEHGFEDYAQGVVAMTQHNCEQSNREFLLKEVEELLKRPIFYLSPQLFHKIAKQIDEMYKIADAEEAKLFKLAV